MILPLIVAAIALLFTVLLVYQYLNRHRPYQLVWAAALAMGALAGFFFALFLAFHRDVVYFRLYYVFGALLMAAYLGLGEIYLLAPRKAANIVAAVIGLLSVVGLVLLLGAPIKDAVLTGANVEAGTNAVSGPAVAFIAVLNAFGALAVIGGAAYSLLRLVQRNGPVHIMVGNMLIAAGTLLASLAGTLARVTANGSSFWLLLALGFVVLFGGFLFSSGYITLGSSRPLTSVARERRT